jgi:ParB/RepB/Spo0J family partition protein
VTATHPQTAVHLIPLVLIAPGPNVRTQLRDIDVLAASIRAQGVLQPITVQARTGYPGQYQLVMGQRRLAAAKQAGLREIPALLVSAAEAGKLIARQLVENLQRDPMTPIEKSAGIRKLMREHGWSQAQVANALGYSTGYVSQLLTMQELDAATQQRVADGLVPVADAVAAVRESRRVQREGGPRRPKPAATRPAKVSLEPAWFTDTHPLARQVRVACELAGHKRPKVGPAPGCGQCWQAAIEDKAVRAERARVAELRGVFGPAVPAGSAAS